MFILGAFWGAPIFGQNPHSFKGKILPRNDVVIPPQIWRPTINFPNPKSDLSYKLNPVLFPTCSIMIQSCYIQKFVASIPSGQAFFLPAGSLSTSKTCRRIGRFAPNWKIQVKLDHHPNQDIYIYICMDGCMYVCMHACMYVCISLTHTHIYIYTR